MVIGVPTICFKKYGFYKKPQKIPKPNIIISKTQKIPTQAISTQGNADLSAVDIDSTNQAKPEGTSISNMDIFEFVGKSPPNIAKMPFNTSKSNKNLINYSGITIFSAIFIGMAYVALTSRSDWSSQTVETYGVHVFIFLCCSPIILSTMYFFCKPKHLISVLKDFNFL